MNLVIITSNVIVDRPDIWAAESIDMQISCASVTENKSWSMLNLLKPGAAEASESQLVEFTQIDQELVGRKCHTGPIGRL